jgi:hypothetical protein
MDIRIGNTTYIKSRPKNKVAKSEGSEIILRKDRREEKRDRRKSTRDGVYVSISYKRDRRRGGDRRKKR